MFRASTRDHKNGSQNNAKNRALTIIEAWPPTVSTTLYSLIVLTDVKPIQTNKFNICLANNNDMQYIIV
jgi:hypothetical protein